MTVAEKTFERRRVDTWHAIHDAASNLALQDGVAPTTIDAIASSAGVSRRTFFNYFPTKEDAVLGLEHPQLTDDVLADFQTEEGDLLSALVRFVVAVSLSATRLSPESLRRRELIQRFPELRVRIQQQSRDSEALVTPHLLEKLGIGPDDDVDVANAMLKLAGTIARFAFAKKPNPSNLSNAEIDAAVELFRNITKENR